MTHWRIGASLVSILAETMSTGDLQGALAAPSASYSADATRSQVFLSCSAETGIHKLKLPSHSSQAKAPKPKFPSYLLELPS